MKTSRLVPVARPGGSELHIGCRPLVSNYRGGDDNWIKYLILSNSQYYDLTLKKRTRLILG